jgi:transcriptional regulator with XRE-family HTH domain
MGLLWKEGFDMTENRKVFGDNLRQAIMNVGWNYSDLARAATKIAGRHISRDSISKYVAGTHFPRENHLAAIAKALGVDAGALAGRLPGPRNIGRLSARQIGDNAYLLEIEKVLPRDVAFKIMAMIHEHDSNTEK